MSVPDGHVRGWGGVLYALPEQIAKEDAPCCAATRDQFGRYCIGFCSPECIRRPK